MIRKLSRKVMGGVSVTKDGEVEELTTPKVLLAENKLTTQRSTQDSAREEEEKEDKLPRLQDAHSRTHSLYKKKPTSSIVQRSSSSASKTGQDKHRRNPSVKSRNAKFCEVCYKEFTNPKELPCNHVFCFSCLLQYVNPKMLLDCPKCRQAVTVDSGLTNLADYHTSKDQLEGINNEHLDQNCQICHTAGTTLVTCLHCAKMFCDMCLEPHMVVLTKQRSTMKHHLQEASDTLALAVTEFRDGMSDIAVEADEAVESQICELQRKREKLDEELCDLLNMRNNEMDRLQKGISSLTDKLSLGIENISREEKMKLLKTVRVEYDKLNRDMDLFVQDKIVLEAETLSIACELSGTKTKKGKAINISVCGLDEVSRLSWSGCVQPVAVKECPWNGQVWITAPGSGEIGVFKDGKLVNTVSHQGMLYPSSIAFNIQDREIYVADQRQQCIWVINGDSYEVIRSFGKESKKHRLNAPCSIAVDLKQRLLILNTGDTKIQVWSAKGEYQRNLGNSEDGFHGISHPSYLVLNKAGKRVAILDSVDNRVYVVSTVSWRTLNQLGDKERMLSVDWDTQDHTVILFKDKIKVYDGMDLVKTEKIDVGATSLYALGGDLSICYTHHVSVRSWREKN